MIAAVHRLLARLRALSTVDALDDDFTAELYADLELRAAAYRRRGLDPAQADAQARRDLGGLSALREAHREARSVVALDHLGRDLRLSLRSLRRTPIFTGFAIATLALGLGASATVYSLVHAVLVQPLPFAAPDRLVWVANVADDGLAEWRVQVNHLRDLQKEAGAFMGFAGYYGFARGADATLTVNGRIERITSQPVTQDFLPLLGVAPAIGRSFTEAEARFHGAPAVILTHRFWQERFAGAADILGRSLVLDGRAVPVVGVLPASFDFASVFAPGGRTDVLVPYPLSDETNRSGNTVAVVGRMRDDVTFDTARDQLLAVATTLERAHPERNTLRPKVVPLATHVSGQWRAALLLLAGAVLLVMLIVAANLANLQFARAAARRRELAVRAALGADRLRLLAPALCESLVLVVVGGACGTALAVAGTGLLSRLNGINLPLLQTVRVDRPGLLVLIGLAALLVLLIGILPPLRVAGSAAQDGLRDGSRGNTTGHRAALIRNGLVVAEVTLACLLLVGAGLLVRSLVRVLDVPLGFRPDGVVAIRIDPDDPRDSRAGRNAFFDDVLSQVRATPGVSAAALVDVLPLDGNRSRGVVGQGQVFERGRLPEGFVRVVTDGYAASLGVEVVAGREFTPSDADGREPVALVNQTLARTLWPGQDPLGRMVMAHGARGLPRRVIGVLADVRHRALEQASGSEVYLPLRQTDDYRAVYLTVRGPRPVGDLASQVRARLASVSPTLPTNDVRVLSQIVDRAVSPRRFLVWLLVGFAAFASLLAALGIYAVVAYTTGQRVTEFGVRLALGATARSVRRQVLVQTVRLALLGVCAGTGIAWVLAVAARDLLFEVSPRDLSTFGGAALAMVTIAVVAAYGPAWRASRIEPLRALRND